MRNIIAQDPIILNYVSENDFAEAARTLLKTQKKNWKQLFDGYESLKNVKTNSFPFNGFEMKVQHNSKRIVSSTAKVDNESIKQRECFLCKENLPEGQEGILYKDEYYILGNPFPIFPEHFTISHIKHIPQEIEHSFHYLLLLAKDLSKYFTVFYNGPECGASAPDHLHFQAGIKNFMPVEKEFYRLKRKYGEILFEGESLTITIIDDGLRRFLSFESKESKILESSFETFYKIYTEISENRIEPMMNILAFYENEFTWRVLVFLREKHRPSFFYAKGEKNFIWSPALVDLGGICIIPNEKDFNNISRDIIVTGFHQITISRDKFLSVKEKLKIKY